jgi:hypothetical protein
MRLPLASSALVHALFVAALLSRGTTHPTAKPADVAIEVDNRGCASAPAKLVEPDEATAPEEPTADVARVAQAKPQHGGIGYAPIGLDAPDLLEQIQAQIASWDGYYVAPVHTSATNKWAPDEFLSGRVPRSSIERAVSAQMHVILLCHGAGGPSSLRLGGDVRVVFVIDGHGHVSEAHEAGGTFADAAVRRCIADAFRGLTFPWPSNGAPQTVTYVVPLVGEDATAP